MSLYGRYRESRRCDYYLAYRALVPRKSMLTGIMLTGIKGKNNISKHLRTCKLSHRFGFDFFHLHNCEKRKANEDCSFPHLSVDRSKVINEKIAKVFGKDFKLSECVHILIPEVVYILLAYENPSLLDITLTLADLTLRHRTSTTVERESLELSATY